MPERFTGAFFSLTHIRKNLAHSFSESPPTGSHSTLSNKTAARECYMSFVRANWLIAACHSNLGVENYLRCKLMTTVT